MSEQLLVGLIVAGLGGLIAAVAALLVWIINRLGDEIRANHAETNSKLDALTERVGGHDSFIATLKARELLEVHNGKRPS